MIVFAISDAPLFQVGHFLSMFSTLFLLYLWIKINNRSKMLDKKEVMKKIMNVDFRYGTVSEMIGGM